MTRSYIVIIALFLSGITFCFSQVSMECATAIPICNNTPVNGGTNGFGSDDFNGASSSGCLEQTITGAIESNSAWYHFRTGERGELGFNIGHDTDEDWDFALYQSSDCTNLGDPLRCNFFDNRDQSSFTGVGEDPTGQPDSVQYDSWLTVEPGQDYYLLINNFSNSNSGFSIQFSGQVFEDYPLTALDCSIVNNLLGPPLAACANETVVLDATTFGALSYTWYEDIGAGFTEIVGETDPTLQVLNDAIYRVRVVTPSETIISDVQVAFTTAPLTEPLIDELFCHSDGLLFDLGAKEMEALGAQNPLEYIVSFHSSQTDADLGINPLPRRYPKNPGSETIYVRTASVENPNCFDALQSFELNALEVPVLTFDENVNLCDNASSVLIGETISDPGYTYLWSTGETTPSILVTQNGTYTLTATSTSSSESCSTTRTVTVASSAVPVITDVQIDDLQSSNTVTIITDVDGEFEYSLDNGTFQTSNVFNDVLPGVHTLTMRDLYGCGEVTEDIVVVGFLNHFSPNGDGLNENWHMEDLSNLSNPVVTIYDRYGKFIKQLTEFSSGWDGNFNGKPMPATDYWFKLSYLDDNGNRVVAKYMQSHFSLRR